MEIYRRFIMDNRIKKEYEIQLVEKDISEREKIIRDFTNYGYLDRNDAINKIISLQMTDFEMTLATRAKQIESGTANLYLADEKLIIDNIQFQLDFLELKLAKLEMEEIQNGKDTIN